MKNLFKWLFSDQTKIENAKIREQEQADKLKTGQEALLQAANSTTYIAQNISDILKQTLDDSLRQLETTTKIINDALIVCDNIGKIVAANPASERIFEYSSQELIGTSILSLFKTINTQADFDNLISIIESEYSRNIDEPHSMLHGLRKNNKEFWLDINISKLERSDGTFDYIFLIRDLTNKQELEHLLAIQKENRRFITDNNIDLVICLDKSFNITFANDAFLKFFNTDTVINSNWLDVIAYEIEKAAVEKCIKNCIHTSCRIQHHVYDGDHELCLHDWVYQAVYNDKKQLVEYQAIGRDISDIVKRFI